jgi:hypothetical protein
MASRFSTFSDGVRHSWQHQRQGRHIFQINAGRHGQWVVGRQQQIKGFCQQGTASQASLRPAVKQHGKVQSPKQQLFLQDTAHCFDVVQMCARLLCLHQRDQFHIFQGHPAGRGSIGPVAHQLYL